MKTTADKLKESGTKKKITHIICYSGGHSSAKVAMNVINRYPDDDVIFLNHNISPSVEDADIKRFKNEVADMCGVPITYANYEGITDQENIPDQFDVCVKIKGFKFGNGTELCTYQLKTKPFHEFLKNKYPVDPKTGRNDSVVIYYGFDKTETSRIQRRSSILGEQGYFTDYPLALWEDVNNNIVVEHGIEPPLTYKQISCTETYGSWKHANCVGCLKAGKQHWYVTYCVRPDIWEKAKTTEEKLKHSIIKGNYLEELEPMFAKMKEKGIPPTEHIPGVTFWAMVRKVFNKGEDVDELFNIPDNEKPCECTI